MGQKHEHPDHDLRIVGSFAGKRKKCPANRRFQQVTPAQYSPVLQIPYRNRGAAVLTRHRA
jgi:hypothetical protein